MSCSKLVVVLVLVVAASAAHSVQVHVVYILVVVHQVLLVSTLDLHASVHLALVHYYFRALLHRVVSRARSVHLGVLARFLVLHHHLVFL